MKLPQQGDQHHRPHPLEGRKANRGLRVLVVEDHKLFGEAIASALQGDSFGTVEVASSAKDAFAAARRDPPNIALIDVRLPDADGLQLGRAMVEAFPTTRVIALHDANDGKSVRRAAQIGFHGYLTKDASLSQCVSVIRSVLEGLCVFPHSFASVPSDGHSGDDTKGAEGRARLTPREVEILRLLAEGARSEDIARRLSVSHNTVRTHIGNILAKLKVHSRLEAAAYALRHGIISMREGTSF